MGCLDVHDKTRDLIEEVLGSRQKMGLDGDICLANSIKNILCMNAGRKVKRGSTPRQLGGRKINKEKLSKRRDAYQVGSNIVQGSN